MQVCTTPSLTRRHNKVIQATGAALFREQPLFLCSVYTKSLSSTAALETVIEIVTKIIKTHISKPPVRFLYQINNYDLNLSSAAALEAVIEIVTEIIKTHIIIPPVKFLYQINDFDFNLFAAEIFETVVEVKTKIIITHCRLPPYIISRVITNRLLD